MKKIPFLILFSFVFFTSRSNEIANNYIIGKIYKINGDTLIAKIHLSSTYKNFIKTLYLDNFGHYLDEKNKVRGLNANKINGFELLVDSTNYIFIAKSVSKKNDKKQFFHLINNKNSTVKLYEFYNNAIMAASLVVSPFLLPELADAHYMIEYNNGVLYQPKRKDFRYDKLAFILSDNKAIERKIEDMVYKYEDIPLIIAEYNNWYSTK